VQERSLHIEVHREDGRFWTQVTEWPGCFATGETLQELMEAGQDNLALCVTLDGHDLTDIKVRIDGIDLRIGSEQPLNPAGGEVSVSRLSTPPRTHRPHSEWGFGRFERRSH
jgi:predicted RNase H-like HicB family nuclease